MFKFASFPPTLTETQNRILKGVKAMPLKNEAADGDSSFAMGRKYYTDTIQTETSLTNRIILKKKYLGGNNRDASSVIDKKKYSQIGAGSVNAEGINISFTPIKDNNQVHRSLARLRGSGHIMPVKLAKSYIIRHEEQVATIRARPKVGSAILIIGDNNASNEVALLASELTFVDENGISPLGKQFEMKDRLFTKTLVTYDSDFMPYDYDGSDLLITNYAVVILFTEDNAVDNFTTRYHPNFGTNLKNYIVSGGNVIFGNFFLQNLLSNFIYSNIPYAYTKKNVYAETLLATINYNLVHPITTNVNPNIALTPQRIVSNIAINPQASTLASTTNGIPFISIYKNPISGSRTVGFNSYLGTISPAKDDEGVIIHNYAILIYNSIYWCMGLV
jgi:hypothetical protein